MNQLLKEHLRTLPAGTVVRVSHGLYDHVAMLGDSRQFGERMIIGFSAEVRGLIEQPYSAFSRGRIVKIDGYLGNLPSTAVMWRARQKKGSLYSWRQFNCEHFVRYAHGVTIESPQLKQWAFISAIGLLGIALARA